MRAIKMPISTSFCLFVQDNCKKPQWFGLVTKGKKFLMIFVLL